MNRTEDRVQQKILKSTTVMILSPAACSTFVFVIICFALSDCTTCTDGLECGRPRPLPRRVPRPRIDPSKYLADPDRTDYKPFNIHFVLLHGLDEEMCEEMRRYINFANARLAEILKAPALADIRLEREWDDDTEDCFPPMCSPWDLTIIPGEYSHPCVSPLTNDTIPDDPPVPEEPTPFIQALNDANDITMVVFVDAIEPGQSSREHEAECKRRAVTTAYSEPCQYDPITDRPTHGYIGWCRRPHQFTAEKAERIFLHEILHIVMHSSVVGMGSPYLGCPWLGDEVQSLVQCKLIRDSDHSYIFVHVFPGENITYKPVVQLWRNADESVTWRTRLLTITPNVVEAARRHFGCNTLEGAEIKARNVTERESIDSGGTVAAGTLIPEGHWSATLLVDEILMPHSHGHMRLSPFTVGLLKDLGWYEVNMDAAESVGKTKPDDPDVGCRIAEQSFVEIIAFWRELQRMSREQPRWEVKANMGPYCDNDYTDKMTRIHMKMCYNDREPLWCLDVPDPPCSVLARAKFYDSFACDQTGIVSDLEGIAMSQGVIVGQQSICVTIGPLRRRVQLNQAGVCVQYNCDYERNEVVLKWKPFNRTCTMRCPDHASDRVYLIDTSYQQECRDIIGHNIRVICPNYTNVCPPVQPMNEPQQIAPVVGKNESEQIAPVLGSNESEEIAPVAEGKISENNAVEKTSPGITFGLVLLVTTIKAMVVKLV